MSPISWIRSVGTAALTLLALGILLATLPAGMDAQQRRGRQVSQPQAPWPAITVGAHFGYDESSNGSVLGAQIRIPILRSGHVELMPSGDLTFVRGLRERQFNADAVFLLGGRRGGLYGGGGLAFRNTVFGTSAGQPRETKKGYNLMVGLKSGGGGAFGSQLELRWTFLSETPLDPRAVTFGVNFPLWD